MPQLRHEPHSPSPQRQNISVIWPVNSVKKSWFLWDVTFYPLGPGLAPLGLKTSVHLVTSLLINFRSSGHFGSQTTACWETENQSAIGLSTCPGEKALLPPSRPFAEGSQRLFDYCGHDNPFCCHPTPSLSHERSHEHTYPLGVSGHFATACVSAGESRTNQVAVEMRSLLATLQALCSGKTRAPFLPQPACIM